MKKYLFIAATCFALSAFATSCVNRVTPSAFGEVVTLEYADHHKIDCELVALRANDVVVLADSLHTIPNSLIHSISLHRSHNFLWVPHIVILNGINAAFLAGYIYAGTQSSTLPYIAAGVWLLELISFAASEPQFTFDYPLSTKERSKLQLEARYPEGLDSLRLKWLEAGYNKKKE